MSGPLIAVLSCAIGGTAIGATRFLAPLADPLTIGALRFVGAFAFLALLALWQGSAWPKPRDRRAAIGFGLVLFAAFPVFFNAALIYTTAARGGLALVTGPMITMVVSGLLGLERITARKVIGVAIAVGGTAVALGAGLSSAPPGAWRGDLLMVGAALCMVIYNIGTRPYIERSSPLGFSAFGMGVGGTALAFLSVVTGGAPVVATFTPTAWFAIAYVALVGGAIGYYMWVIAIRRTSPTLVTISLTVNPVTAAIYGALLLGEPITATLVAGFLTVLAGIVIAATGRKDLPTPPSVEPAA